MRFAPGSRSRATGAMVVALSLAVVALLAPGCVSAELSVAEDAQVPMWGDDNTEVDTLDQHTDLSEPLVLLDEEEDLDLLDEEAAEAESEDEDELDADEEEAFEDAEDGAEAADDAVTVEEEHSEHSARAIAGAAAVDGAASGMRDAPAAGASLVEHTTTTSASAKHVVPLHASTWAAMVVDAKGYSSNVLHSSAKTKGGPCAGIIASKCKHMADMQPAITTMGGASKWQDQCAKLICNPLCLRYTWDVKIEASGGPDGFEEAVNSLGTQYSLGAQFRAHACGKVAGCCEENEDLLNWVELRNFAGMFPESPQPTLACDLRANPNNKEQEPTKDDLCAQCKAAITVTAEPKADVCEYFVKVPDPPDMGDETEVFARNGESAAAQIPKHKSFQEKCTAVQGLMAGIISGLASGAWKDKACSCLGCCEAAPGSECYYPVVYGTTDEAYKAHKQ